MSEENGNNLQNLPLVAGGTPGGSRSTSPKILLGKPPMHPQDDELPTNVSTDAQLADLPKECLSGDKERPLRHVDEDGNVYHYALQPMWYSVIFILLVELLERFCFYGVNYTQTAYLTGVYDEDWNAHMASVEASSYVSVSVAVAYTTPFLGAFLADSILGDYNSLLVGCMMFYLPGLVLIALTTIPGLLGETFNSSILAVGLIFLWPLGTGVLKSIVNIFGAKQHHPLLQSSLIESYYVNFYMCINVGALMGGVMIPCMAQINITAAYFTPVATLGLAVCFFLYGTKRYVRVPPSGDIFGKKKAPPPSDANGKLGLMVILKVSSLVVPFNIAYSQMATTFIVQGTVMEKVGFIDAAQMNNADAVAVLFFGYVVGQWLYPALAARDIKIPTTYKFAIGSGFGVAAIGWALLMEMMIEREYHSTGQKVNILWQSVSYILIGVGEIFAVSSAYEVAFSAAPPEKKALASAINLFFVGGLPNFLCIFLYRACRRWFLNSRGTADIHRLTDYAEASVWKYYLVLLLIAFFGVIVNLLPAVRAFVESVEEAAAEAVKTPKPARPSRHKRMDSWDFSDVANEEQSPLLRAKRHQAYLKYGSGPVLYKQGSMRAGPAIKKDKKQAKKVDRRTIAKLYGMQSALVLPQVVLGPSGRPMQAGELPRRDEQKPLIRRSASFEK